MEKIEKNENILLITSPYSFDLFSVQGENQALDI